MAAIAHDNTVNVGDIFGSEYAGTLSGFKVVSRLYIETTADFRYVIQYGSVPSDSNAFTPYGEGKDLGLADFKTITGSYAKKWVKDPDMKDGDVLRSASGVHIFVVRGTLSGEPKLHRVSAGSGMYDKLSNYEGSYGKLSQVTHGYSAGRFSEPIQD